MTSQKPIDMPRPCSRDIDLTGILAGSTSGSAVGQNRVVARIDREDAKGKKEEESERGREKQGAREAGIRTSSLAARIARADSHGAR